MNTAAVNPAGGREAVDSDRLVRAWIEQLSPLTSSPDVATTGKALVASWADPTRKYHDVTHLSQVLAGIDELAAHASDRNAVRLAAWYHDAVYRGQPDDEDQSAQRAHVELTHLGLDPDLVEEVTRLIRLTVTHHPAPDDANGQVLCDADLAILASTPGDYGRYTAAVRAEYSYVTDDQFRIGRATVLRGLLDAPSLFGTPEGQRRWETPARANLVAELANLTT